MIKFFISYHHLREQILKDKLSEKIEEFNKNSYIINNLIISDFQKIKDNSVFRNDINTQLSDKEISITIREQYLKDSDVTIVILGQHTKCRKHIDKEIGASLRRYGSLDNITKLNALIILLTDDFIKAANNKNDSNTDDYSSLITLENAGQRIYENYQNGYAVVDKISNVLKRSPFFLLELVKKSQKNKTIFLSDKHFEIKHWENFDLINKNLEKCPGLNDLNPKFLELYEKLEPELRTQGYKNIEAMIKGYLAIDSIKKENSKFFKFKLLIFNMIKQSKKIIKFQKKSKNNDKFSSSIKSTQKSSTKKTKEVLKLNNELNSVLEQKQQSLLEENETAPLIEKKQSELSRHDTNKANQKSQSKCLDLIMSMISVLD